MALATAQPIDTFPRAEVNRLALVRIWLFALAALVMAMVAVGGATRLTGSGLSITEWRPVTGAVPPLSEQAWTAEFEKYRQIPQYELVNKGMTLDAFKTIYWWEWSHRQLGRLLGLVFFLPLIAFWVTGAVRGRLALALLGLGALGGLQGAIGWIMVASGLQPGMTAVAPIKLTLHLTTASLILAGLFWIVTGLGQGVVRASTRRADASSLSPALTGERADGVARRGAYLLLALVLLQIALGGLVAGSKAGLTYNTWPLMDGRLVPPLDGLFAVTPWIENFVDNVALVQFNHRLIAYLLVAAALWHAMTLHRRAAGTSASRRAWALAGLTLSQATLGVVTLLLVVPLWAGLAHQVVAMLVLAMATVHARLSASGG